MTKETTMGEGEKKTEMKTVGPIKKVPRDVEIKQALMAMERKHNVAMGEHMAGVASLRREEMHKNLAAHQANHAVKNKKVLEARAALDKAKKEAEKVREEAIRKAKGDCQRAINEATQAFEAVRDALEVEVAALNKPLQAEYEAKDAEIVEAAKTTAQAMAEAFENECKPLKEEAAALQQALEEKQKKRAEREAQAKEAEPAPPTP